jgi:pimeloyl-ACP methyl ester carboxylesterase
MCSGQQTERPMPLANVNGVDIHFIDEGPRDGAPILLIHGFASNIKTNWVDPLWVKFLTGNGRRVIAMDCRGHGQSAKLYRQEDYGSPLMAEDARSLLDHLGIATADIMGYSMGARITAFLAMNHPNRVRAAIFGGLGINMVRGLAGTGPIAHALEADSIDDVTNATARTFRAFAEATKSDLKALAMCIRSARAVISAEMLQTIRSPVLVAVGTDDVIGGSASALAALIPGAEALELQGRDHMRAVGDRTYRTGVEEFLKRRA